MACIVVAYVVVVVAHRGRRRVVRRCLVVCFLLVRCLRLHLSFSFLLVFGRRLAVATQPTSSSYRPTVIVFGVACALSSGSVCLSSECLLLFKLNARPTFHRFAVCHDVYDVAGVSLRRSGRPVFLVIVVFSVSCGYVVFFVQEFFLLSSFSLYVCL